MPWELLSANPYGYVYRDKNRIIKLLPEFQKKEVEFWKRLSLRPDESCLFVIPKISQENIARSRDVADGRYYLLNMERKPGILSDLQKSGLTPKTEARVIADMRRVFGILFRGGFVHADVHAQNILCNARRSRFFLIDFGLVLHAGFCQTEGEAQVHSLYLWSRDDYFSLLRVLFFSGNEHLLIRNNDYKDARDCWRRHFQRLPKQWHRFKDHFRATFDGSREDYRYCMEYFLDRVLSPDNGLSPSPGVYLYDMLTKIFLDRAFLVFAVYYPTKIGMTALGARPSLFRRALRDFPASGLPASDP
jgi:hypothetical protein